MTLARPNKTTGRVVLGPRLVDSEYVRIVALADGGGRVEIYDKEIGTWGDASERYTFSDVWGASVVTEARHLASLQFRMDASTPRPPSSTPARNRKPGGPS